MLSGGMMNGRKITGCCSLSFMLMIVLGVSSRMRAQDNPTPYPSMAALDQYLMGRDAEIALARSAAPDSISRGAKVLVLGRRGYETAVEGKNGFVCIVERGWMQPFDKPDFWNPKVRLPLCMNPSGARSHMPLTVKATELALAGAAKEQMAARLKAAYDSKELPLPENCSMCYMMSKPINRVHYFNVKTVGRNTGNGDVRTLGQAMEKHNGDGHADESDG
jgi:hypothetical protein